MTQELPLAGIRVIELARVLAGPWAGQALADLGAEVIKIESPAGGDDTRSWGPPFIRDSHGESLSAAYYHCANRGKKSVAIDFATAEGAAAIRDLARTSDVLIENFKVGGLRKYGLDYETLRAVNPRLVYCSITGFGQTGPYAPRPGYDFIIQAMAGMMSITGEPGREPQKAGVAIADLFTGLYATIAIQAALRHAEHTGQGQHVDMALFDCQIAALANQNMNYLASGVAPPQMGNAQVNISPYEVMPAADGDIVLAVGNDGQFRRLCEVIGLPELATDARFVGNSARVANRVALRALIVSRLATLRRDDVLADLEARGVPAGPINSIAQMFDDPQTKERGMRIDLADDRGDSVPGVRAPIVFSETPLRYERPSPRLGQHTDEVLAGLKRDRT